MVPHRRKRFSVIRPPGRWLAALVLVAGLGLAAPAHGNTCAPAAVKGTAPSDYQDYCWLDFTGYSDAQARAGGQPFHFTLPNGSALDLTLQVASTNSGTSLAPHAVPSWPGAAFGNTAFLNIPGRPVLYQPQDGSTVNVTLRNIAVTPPTGSGANAVYSIIAADGESTNQNESLAFTTNGQAWAQVAQIPNGSQYPTVAGVGTTTVTETGKPGTVGRYVFASFNNPTNVMPTNQSGTTFTFPTLQYGDAISCVFTNIANRANLASAERNGSDEPDAGVWSGLLA